MSEQDLEQQDEQLEDENLEIETPEEDEDRDDPESTNEDTQEEGEEFDIVVGDEKPEEQDEDDFHGKPAPQWVKDLRRDKKESDRRIKELEAKLNQQAQPENIELGEKPTLESVNYDADEFEAKLTEWHAKKLQFEQQEASKREEQEKANKVWQDKLKSYEAKKTATKLKVRDYDEAEEIARDVLTPTQQGILIHGAEKPDLLIYHLGKNPKKAKELAAITDPIQFAFEAAKIDAQIKMTARKPSTSPERKPSGSGSLSSAVDAKEAELEKEAIRTGDRTKLIQYRKSKGK